MHSEVGQGSTGQGSIWVGSVWLPGACSRNAHCERLRAEGAKCEKKEELNGMELEAVICEAGGRSSKNTGRPNSVAVDW